MSANKIKDRNLSIGVQLFSDMMLMKFKPKNTQGMNLLKQYAPFKQQIKRKYKFSDNELDHKMHQKMNHILFIQAASNDTYMIGNHNQIDMIGIIGINKMFVDTYYYWSLNIQKPIIDLKVNTKKKIFTILTYKTLSIYNYSQLMIERNQPIYSSSIQLPFQVKFLQFTTQDLLAVFYEQCFQIYYVNDNNQINKILSKKYNTPQKFKLLAVPQAVESTIKIFFEEQHQDFRTFGLWCIEVQIENESFHMNKIYKIYDIMLSLKKILILQNYSKEIIFLNFGRQLLVAKKGYIIDSVSINIQIQHSFLKYLPNQQILVHIQRNYMDLYSFKINTNANPNKIELKSIDSIAINKDKNAKLVALHSIYDKNFILFYEDYQNKRTTRGEIFYNFLVSYTVPLSVKIKSIISIAKIQTISPEELQARCDILRKIGLSDQEIYLQIWHFSNRSSVVQFNILLATGDYKTIKAQIQAKLRKKSMHYKQIYKIQESCEKIIRQKMMKMEFSDQMLKDYISCHFFLRKLKLFKELFIINLESKAIQKIQSFQITIEDYNNIRNAQLKTFILKYLNDFMVKKVNNLSTIRTILFHFKFVYRYIYYQLLEEIIKLSKQDLIKLLQAIPELLPIDAGYLDYISDEQRYLHTGVWFKISQEQWENNIYHDKLVHAFNYDDKEHMSSFVNQIWFHRNWLLTHDLIPTTNAQIEKKNNEANSVAIFYFFIDKVFQYIHDEKQLRLILSYVEKNYLLYPNHLKDKVRLYSKLYIHYKQNRTFTKKPLKSMEQFLKQGDQKLFKYYFEYERFEKNFLLKKIKPLFEQYVNDGFNVFNEILIKYFKSPLSEISHLKYILNRINNEKEEFHKKNQKMYEVLIQAFQLKVKIGTGKQQTIKEILIYVQSIPFSADNHFIIQEIRAIQRISMQTDILKKVQINMTIREIRQKYHEVIEKVVIYNMNKLDIMHAQNHKAIMNKTKKILDEVNKIQENLYGKQNYELSFFIFLSKLFQDHHKVYSVSVILNDEYYNDIYQIDLTFVENLVIYMYRWKFSQNLSYVDNSQYLTTIVEILPEQNSFKKYILGQLELALQLSTPTKHVQFPLGQEFIYPKISYIQNIVKKLDSEELMQINIESIVELIKKLQNLSQASSSNASNLLSVISKSSHSEKIEDHLIYKMFLKYYLKAGKIKQSINLIKLITEKDKSSTIVEMLAIINTIIPQLNHQSKRLLIKISAFLYYKPLQLQKVIEAIALQKLTGLQCIAILTQKYNELQQTGVNFSENNPIFNKYFQRIKKQQEKTLLINISFQKILKKSKHFKHNYHLTLIYLLMCYEPFKLPYLLMYFEVSQYIHFKTFIGNLIQQDIFYEDNVLQICKRCIFAVLKNKKKHVHIQFIAEKYRFNNLEEEYILEDIIPLQYDQKVLSKIIHAFQRKIKKIQELNSNKKLRRHYSSPQKQSSILVTLKNIKLNLNDQQDEIFQQIQSSDDYDDLDKTILEDIQKPVIPMKKRPSFKPLNERQKLIQRLVKKRKSPMKIKKFLSQESSGENVQQNDYQSMKEDDFFPNEPVNTKKQKYQVSPRIIINDPPQVKTINLRSKIAYSSEIDIKSNLNQQKVSPSDQILKCEDNSDFSVQHIISIVKNIYKTYTDKLQDQPYSIRYLALEKNKLKQNFPQLLKDLILYVYQNPHRGSLSNSLKLIIQIAKKYRQSNVNVENMIIYQRIAKFEEKFSLNIPLAQILTLDAAYLKSTTSIELYNFIKSNIFAHCTDENIIKMMKLFAIGFKISTLQSQIFFIYFKKILNKIHQAPNEEEQNLLYERVKFIIGKTHIDIIMDKAKSISTQCSNIKIRNKISSIVSKSLRERGNGKDDIQFQNIMR